MEIATSLSRIWRLALMGSALAFAWFVLSLVLGLGSAQAHAAQDDEPGGGLGAVTSMVDQTAGSVTGTLEHVSSAVTGLVGRVVQAAPAPVQQPVHELGTAVQTAVSAVVAPVQDLVSTGVVTGVTAPVVDLVTQLPVAGGAVTGLRLDAAIAALTGTVDETLAGVVGIVAHTATVLPAATASVAEPPRVPVTPAAQMPASTAISGLTHAAVVVSAAVVVATDAITSTISSLGALRAPALAFSGPGGAGPGVWALFALLPFAVHRAWVRRAGPEDERAPAAPAGSTDVSPD